MLRLAIFALAIFAAQPGFADGKRFTLTADPALIESGLMKFMLPRFSLKTGVKVDLAANGEALLGASVEGRAVFQDAAGGDIYRIALDPNAGAHAERFREWLISDIGLRTVESFKADGAAVYARAETGVVETAAEVVEGDIVLGEELALRNCGRCHVVNEKNKFGGIGSTPSFGAMKNLPRWRDRFDAFWTLNPHPSFTQIEGMTEPFDPTRPSPIAPLELSLEQVEAIIAYVVSMPRKDLGGALVEQ